MILGQTSSSQECAACQLDFDFWARNILGETARGSKCVVRKRSQTDDGRLNSNDKLPRHMMRRKDAIPHAEVFRPVAGLHHLTGNFVAPRPAALFGYDTIPSGRCRRSRSPAS